MSSTFNLGQGDTAEPIEAVLEDTVGPVPLQVGDAVVFRMASKTNTVIRPATIVKSMAPIGDPDRGRVRYVWQAGDTTTPGTYKQDWVVTYANGTKATFPNRQADKNIVLISKGVA